jgi:hypothetical protein
MKRKLLLAVLVTLFPWRSPAAGDTFAIKKEWKAGRAGENKPPETIQIVSVNRMTPHSAMDGVEEYRRPDRNAPGIAAAGSLKEKDSFDFRPPRLRFFTGMAYYHHVTAPHFKNRAGDIGLTFGASYDLKRRHSFQALASVLYSLAASHKHTSLEIRWPDDPMRRGLAESTINFTRSIQYQAGYGIIFQLFSGFYMRPSFFLGNCHIQYESLHAGYHQSDVIGPEYELVAGGTKTTGYSTSYLANLTADVLMNYNRRASYFMSIGYKALFSPFMDSWSYDYDNQKMSGLYDAIISGLTVRAGVAVGL